MSILAGLVEFGGDAIERGTAEEILGKDRGPAEIRRQLSRIDPVGLRLSKMSFHQPALYNLNDRSVIAFSRDSEFASLGLTALIGTLCQPRFLDPKEFCRYTFTEPPVGCNRANFYGPRFQMTRLYVKVQRERGEIANIVNRIINPDGGNRTVVQRLNEGEIAETELLLLGLATKRSNADLLPFFVRRANSKLCIEAALHSGANVNHRTNHALKTPLHVAAKYNNPVTTRMLLSLGAQLETRDHLGRTPLRVAADHHNYSVEAARVLLENGANVNSRDIDGYTPLHTTAAQGGGEKCIEMMKLLREHGADLSSVDHNGTSVLQSAMESRNPEVVWYVLKWKLHNYLLDLSQDELFNARAQGAAVFMAATFGALACGAIIKRGV